MGQEVLPCSRAPDCRSQDAGEAVAAQSGTVGSSSPWILTGMLQQREGRICGGDAGASRQPNQAFSANRHCFSHLDTDGGLSTDLLKETTTHAVWEDAVPWISHLTPPFSVFQQSGLAAGDEKGGKGSSSILMGSLTRSLAEVIIHPHGYQKRCEPSLNETPRWVGVWGRRGEWEWGEGQRKGMSSVCARDHICCTFLPFPNLPANGEDRQSAR